MQESPYSPEPIRVVRRSNRWAAALSFLLLAAIATVDHFSHGDASFGLFYLIPICVAAWYAGQRTGIILCICAAAIAQLSRMSAHPSLTQSLWNTGIRFGIFLVVCVLLSELKTHRADFPIVRLLGKLFGLSAGFAAVLALAGFVVQRESKDFHPTLDQSAMAMTTANPPPTSPVKSTVNSTVSSTTNLSANLSSVIEPPTSLANLAKDVEASLTASRPVLLGSRDPLAWTCVPDMLIGQVQGALPTNPGDLDGGPGTKMAVLVAFDRQNFKKATDDFAWHQGRLRKFLDNLAISNAGPQQLAERLTAKTQALAETIQAWTAVPPDFHAAAERSAATDKTAPTTQNAQTTWLGYCFASLNRAIEANDLDSSRHWSAELASAAFALNDLHRWLAFLIDNQLTALDFQTQCASLFTAADPLNNPYDPSSTLSQFPAGELTLHGLPNYYEVEHQAERLFTLPKDSLDELTKDSHPSAAAIWVPPALRDYFHMLEQSLSPENQQGWEQAAKTPYEHSYLVNMLYRASHGDMSTELATVLKRFDANHPHATERELMGVMMYRGHSFGGIEWADRFQPQLMNAAAEISKSESDADAFVAACKWTNQFYRPAAYGVTFTLRDAIEQHRMDCVRSTDMIGAIYRDAGRTRFGHVRWCLETNGHSVAALLNRNPDGSTTTLIDDGMHFTEQPEVWPNCYFHGHAWPPGFENNPTPYAVELYTRGLDNYIWAEGYIIRGPNAGMLSKAAVPYSSHRAEKSSTKVFEGPYPEK